MGGNFVIREQCKFSQKVPPSQTFLTACFINFLLPETIPPQQLSQIKTKLLKTKCLWVKEKKLKNF